MPSNHLPIDPRLTQTYDPELESDEPQDPPSLSRFNPEEEAVSKHPHFIKPIRLNSNDLETHQRTQ